MSNELELSERYQYKITCVICISNIIIEMHLALQGAYKSQIFKYITVVSIWKMPQQIYHYEGQALAYRCVWYYNKHAWFDVMRGVAARNVDIILHYTQLAFRHAWETSSMIAVCDLYKMFLFCSNVK